MCGTSPWTSPTLVMVRWQCRCSPMTFSLSATRILPFTKQPPALAPWLSGCRHFLSVELGCLLGLQCVHCAWCNNAAILFWEPLVTMAGAFSRLRGWLSIIALLCNSGLLFADHFGPGMFHFFGAPCIPYSATEHIVVVVHHGIPGEDRQCNLIAVPG